MCCFTLLNLYNLLQQQKTNTVVTYNFPVKIWTMEELCSHNSQVSELTQIYSTSSWVGMLHSLFYSLRKGENHILNILCIYLLYITRYSLGHTDILEGGHLRSFPDAPSVKDSVPWQLRGSSVMTVNHKPLQRPSQLWCRLAQTHTVCGAAHVTCLVHIRA